jgi:hypothetical protein
MQTRSQSRKKCKIYSEVLMNIIETVHPVPKFNTLQDNQLKMVSPSKNKQNTNSSLVFPIIENNETNEINIVTRSRSKKNYPIHHSIMNSISNTIENIENKVDIDFDNASRAWMRNKRKLGNGEYSYI